VRDFVDARFHEEGQTMTEHSQVLQNAFATVARWVARYRDVLDPRRQFEGCTPAEVEAIAHDLAMTPRDLLNLTSGGPQGARLLSELLLALDVDPKKLSEQDPMMMRDMQRLCVSCTHKRQCTHDLAAGTMAHNYVDFCPNAYTLDLLLEDMHKCAGAVERTH
jgi:hypothetical protein